MDDVRQSFSKLKKDLKHRLGGKKGRADRAGANAAGETAGSSLSPTRPDSCATASGLDEEESGISTDVSQVRSRDRSPQPRPMQAEEGGDSSQGRKADADEKGANRSRLRLGPYVWGVGGGKPSREIKRIPSPLSVTPTSPKREPDSMRTLFPQ